MKRLILIFLGVFAMSFVSGFPCLAGDGPGFGSQKMYHNKTEISLYVNGATGMDMHGHGKFPHKPYQTITFALEVVPLVRKSSDIRVTINVAAGTYKENLYIRLDNIIIQGEGRDVTTIKGNGIDDTVKIVSSKLVEIKGFNITGGNNGILTSFSHLYCENITITGNSNNGLAANNNSYVRLENMIAKANTNAGISINLGSTARVYGGEFSENSRGLYASRNATVYVLAYITDGTTIRAKFADNDREGLFANEGTSFRLEDCDVYGNHRDGIMVTRGSIIRLDWGNSIFDNKQEGIEIRDNSHVNLYGDVIVSDNDRDGIRLYLDSTVDIRNTASITNNDGYEINCIDGKVAGLPSFPPGETNCSP